MARDRKRAKQRQRARRSQPQPAGIPGQPAEPKAEPDTVRDAPPDPVAHASGDAEIAEAAERAIEELDGPTTPLGADEYPQPDELEGADVLGEPEDEEAAATTPSRRQAAAATGREAPREGSRFINFLRACWAELQRVQWPDRRQVAQATAVVLVFVLVAGGYLGLLDAIFSRLINAIL
jgi:preprotein translocase SecE subunit